MVRLRGSAQKPRQPPASPQKIHRQHLTKSEESLKIIERLKEAGKEAHLKARNTNKCYAGHVKRGQEWLASHFASTPEAPEAASMDDDYSDPAFRTAFDRVPNSCSDKALALFLTYKGFHQNLGKGTVEGIRAAFKDLWDKADGDRYRGRWRFDPTSQQWEGNPADSVEVDDLMSSLKHKASSEDGCRTHSLPMSKRFMDSMLEWSLKSCPLIKTALQLLQRVFDGERVTVSDLPMDLKERELVSRHLEQLAFNTTAWTLWTRCFELVKVRWKDVTILDLQTVSHVVRKYLACETLVLSDLSIYFEVHLKNRKGWQRKVDKGHTESDLRGNRYQIYPQPDLPGSDTFVWLLVWIKWLEVFHYERDLGPEDFMFPAMGANGIIQPREQLSHDTVQKWINEATAGAAIRGSFSTHCFRRGGAQYRFMFAPVGQRWPLSVVRWWGGWAEQEHRDTLIRYLLDELHTYENDHSDALAPVSRDANNSLMGEHTLVEPVSTEEIRSFHTSVTTDVRGLRADVSNDIRGLRADVIHLMSGALHELTTLIKAGHTPTAVVPHVPSNSTPRPVSSPADVIHTGTPTTSPANAPGHAVAFSCQPVLQSASLGSGARQSLSDVANLGRLPSAIASVPGSGTHSTFQSTRRKTSSQRIPKPNLFIPHVPSRGLDGVRRPKKDSWREIVQHWTVGAPELGLNTPLKDWPAEWYQGENRKFATPHFERSVIAREFLETYDSNEARFLAAYPRAEQGHTALLHDINAARRARGERASRPRKCR